jgi:metal-responsive CopG/Arc/MetJ family transcriptional regulator
MPAVYSDTMQRTQVYLGSEELELLDRAAIRTGASRSELIRRAIRDRYGDRDWASRRAALQQSAGAWAEREQTGAATVDATRRDLNDRLARLGWS